ncbi:hypothetical protein ACIU1J_24155 [Azospirillum doebereinerae]
MVQSLIRTTCQDCHGAGCPACGGGGYAGRTAISECAVFDDSAAVVAAAKGGRNWPTLFDDAVAKFHAGLTTAAELRRVFGSEASGMEPRMPVPQPPVKPAPKSPRQ